MKVFHKTLPIWESDLEGENTTDRLDNNWYIPTAHLAELEINRVARIGKFELLAFSDVCESDGIRIGKAPDAEGQIALIEGRNLRSNYVLPIFTKFSVTASDVIEGDLLIGKDGEPGTVAPVTKPLLDYCKSLAIGNHVYHLRLKRNYRSAAPFISAFFNSRLGQALLRKRIAGGTTPTIRKTDIQEIPVLIPSDGELLLKTNDAVKETQNRIIESMNNLGPSESISKHLGISETDTRLMTNWAGGGAQRSSRIIS